MSCDYDAAWEAMKADPLFGPLITAPPNVTLLMTIRLLTAQHQTMLDTLTTTQGRCTALIEENRALKIHLAEIDAQLNRLFRGEQP